MKPPKHVYNEFMTVKVTTKVDRYQQSTTEDTDVSNVNFQRVHDTVLNYDSTEVRLNALVFVDADYSTPSLDYWQLQKTSEANGKPLLISHDGDLYEVLAVDRLLNQFGKLDHWELSLK